MDQMLDQIRNHWDLSRKDTLTDWIIGLLMVLLSLLLYFIVSRIISRIGKKSTGQLIRIVWQKFRRPILILVLVLALTVSALIVVPESKDAASLLTEMRTVDGLLFPIPITLPSSMATIA